MVVGPIMLWSLTLGDFNARIHTKTRGLIEADAEAKPLPNMFDQHIAPSETSWRENLHRRKYSNWVRMMILPITLLPWLMGVFVSESSSQKFRQRADRLLAKSQIYPQSFVTFTIWFKVPCAFCKQEMSGRVTGPRHLWGLVFSRSRSPLGFF